MSGSAGFALLCGLPWLLGVLPQELQTRAGGRSSRPTPTKAADFDRIYAGTVNINREEIYSFNYTSKPGQDMFYVALGAVTLSQLPDFSTHLQNTEDAQVDAVRVYVKSDSEDLQYPILFVVRQQKGVLSWQVPLIFRGLYQRTYNYQEVSRTLCPSEPTPEMGPSEQIIFVDVASMALFDIEYELLVTRLKSFQLTGDVEPNKKPQGHGKLVVRMDGISGESYYWHRKDFGVINGTDKAFNFTASPSQPQYFLYKFPPDVNSVIIKVVSETVYPCSVVSVQDIVCPVYDLDHNVEFNGVYQSMTKQAAITVQKKDFPGQQFFVVFVIKPEDYACGGSVPSSIKGKGNHTWNLQRTKSLQVTIAPSIKESDYVQAMLFSFLSFLSFYLGSLIIAFVHYVRVQRKTSAGRYSPDDGSRTVATSHPITTGTPEGSSYGAIEYLDNLKGPLKTLKQVSELTSLSPASSTTTIHMLNPHCWPEPTWAKSWHTTSANTTQDTDESSSSGGRQLSSPEHGPPHGSDTDSSVEEESDFDTMPEIESDKNVIRTKMFLYLSDLSRKDRRIVSKKYKIYFWNIITIAVFYALPVIQLVITYQTVVNVTGNQDICYYNFLCAHPLGVLSAFNNVLSNVGHVLLGFLFLLIVLRRGILHRQSLEAKDTYTLEYGIPKHFGLFYAMGIALMMEGVLSACYHVCPNYSNFQFDTSFMYMIAGLCMLKLYQTRHPDINASAYSAYASFAVVICLAVVGVVFGKNNVWFWVIFSVIHIVASLALSTQIYYMGRFKIDVSDTDFGIFRRVVMVLYTDCFQQCSRPMYMDRMVLLIVGNLVNWSFAVFGLVYRPRDFASYMLGIFICNLLLYLAFYIIMKLRSSEKLLPIPLFCIVATAVVWAAALYFFFQNLSSWEETPAESREKNRPCILLGFFDDHDVWHFLSAAALFFSFLVLLTLDDDLDSVRRDKIPVF